MKTLLYILLISFTTTLQAQSLYNARANTKVSQTTSEVFTISFDKTMYGITFNRNDRVLTNGLKTKIERFMATTNRPKFKGLGTFTLNIIKRQDTYFVVEQNRPEKLIEI